MRNFDFFISREDASLNEGAILDRSTFERWCSHGNHGIYRNAGFLFVDFNDGEQRYEWDDILVAHIELPDHNEEDWTVPVSYREVTEDDKGKVGNDNHRNLL